MAEGLMECILALARDLLGALPYCLETLLAQVRFFLSECTHWSLSPNGAYRSSRTVLGTYAKFMGRVGIYSSQGFAHQQLLSAS